LNLLRERALSNKTVSNLGPLLYAWVVIVPELAVRLIMDDIKVEEEKARKILEESRLVNTLNHS